MSLENYSGVLSKCLGVLAKFIAGYLELGKK